MAEITKIAYEQGNPPSPGHHYKGPIDCRKLVLSLRHWPKDREIGEDGEAKDCVEKGPSDSSKRSLRIPTSYGIKRAKVSVQLFSPMQDLQALGHFSTGSRNSPCTNDRRS